MTTQVTLWSAGMRLCEFNGCLKPVHSCGLCGAHYQQKRHGKELKALQLQFHGLSETERFMRWISKQPDGCWRWMGSTLKHAHTKQYEWHGQWRNAAGKHEIASRAAWRLFVGPIPKGMSVLHTCDVPRCCNVEHLYLGTSADNVRDMINRGRAVRGITQGTKHWASKATPLIVREIRASDDPIAKLALKFGMSRAAVHSIKKRETWKHVK